MTETDGTLKLAGKLKYGIRRAFNIERKTNLQMKSQEYGYYTEETGGNQNPVGRRVEYHFYRRKTKSYVSSTGK